MGMHLVGVETAFAEAALDATRWSAAMDAAARATGSRGAVMIPLRGHLPGLPSSDTVCDLVHSYLHDGWYQRDARYGCVPALMRSGVTNDFDMATAEELARNEFYQDFLAKFGFQWFAGIRVAAGDDVWCLTLQRTADQEPFSPSELHELSRLSGSLGASAAFARALGLARADAAMQAFDMAGTAVVLLDRNAEVVRINAAAEKHLGHDLAIVERRVVSWNKDATALLYKAIRSLMWSPDQAALTPPVALPRRGDQRHPLLVYPIRLPALANDALAPCQLGLTIVDLSRHPRPTEDALKTIFRLTPTEARLAQVLAAGENLETAAGMIGVTKETARVHLKSIFSKTNTHRQGEMIAILNKLPREYSERE